MDKTSRTGVSAIVPAQLNFLAIYNPSLGDHDDTLHNQVLFYSSQRDRRKRSRRATGEARVKEDAEKHEDENEKLRQIGLAQGMVEFARAFSDGEALDFVETEKSKVVLHELESGWWILASIDLTRLPSHVGTGVESSSGATTAVAAEFEYSAREVLPTTLILQHLLRAHAIFLLHHSPTLLALYNRIGRSKLCKALDRFWTQFISEWDVLLHENPAVDVFRGTKLAAGGELGVGVGEEEWGSGEREVLEGLVKRTDGLTDLIVSRSGAPACDVEETTDAKEEQQRNPHGGSHEALSSPSDGVIFSGVQAISKESLRAVADWTECVHLYGEHAYGVRENTSSDLKKRSSQWSGTSLRADHRKGIRNTSEAILNRPRIPPPIVPSGGVSQKVVPRKNTEQDTSSISGSEQMMKYLTLGYGSAWGGRSSSKPATTSTSPSEPGSGNPRAQGETGPSIPFSRSEKSIGHFLIGLQGDLEGESTDTDDEVASIHTDEDDLSDPSSEPRGRILPRTVHVQMFSRVQSQQDLTTEAQRFTFDSMNTLGGSTANDVDGSPTKQHRKLRIVVYVYHPFIFTFLFELRTPVLAIPSFYRSLHHQLGPLQRPLLSSTSPALIASRLASAANPPPTISSTNTSRTAHTPEPIYSLLYSPSTLTIHSTIPPIPEPSSSTTDGIDPHAPGSVWSRIEALNVHTQILNTYAATRKVHDQAAIERTVKTGRGWWVVYMRIPTEPPPATIARQPKGYPTEDQVTTPVEYQEAFLIRRASDHVASKAGRAREVSSTGWGGVTGTAARGLVEGVGVDARRYIEGLLSLNR